MPVPLPEPILTALPMPGHAGAVQPWRRILWGIAKRGVRAASASDRAGGPVGRVESQLAPSSTLCM